MTRKEKSITRSTVVLAYEKAVELGGAVKGPKTLGCFGASYLYPVFVRLGVIQLPLLADSKQVEEDVAETLPTKPISDTPIPSMQTPDTQMPSTQMPDSYTPDTQTPDTQMPNALTPDKRDIQLPRRAFIEAATDLAASYRSLQNQKNQIEKVRSHQDMVSQDEAVADLLHMGGGVRQVAARVGKHSSQTEVAAMALALGYQERLNEKLRKQAIRSIGDEAVIIEKLDIIHSAILAMDESTRTAFRRSGSVSEGVIQAIASELEARYTAPDKELPDLSQKELWELFVSHAGEEFTTYRGWAFSYSIGETTAIQKSKALLRYMKDGFDSETAANKCAEVGLPLHYEKHFPALIIERSGGEAAPDKIKQPNGNADYVVTDSSILSESNSLSESNPLPDSQMQTRPGKRIKTEVSHYLIYHAYKVIRQMRGRIESPSKLRIYGGPYLWAIFSKLGYINGVDANSVIDKGIVLQYISLKDYCQANQSILLSERNTDLLSGSNIDLLSEWSIEKNGKALDTVSAGDTELVWWHCPHGHTWSCSVLDRILFDRTCYFCKKDQTIRKETLYDHCLNIPDGDIDVRYLLDEWDYEKNTLSPADVAPGSAIKVWWKCKHGHSWQALVKNRAIQGQACPYCSNHKYLKGFNDFSVRYPEIAAEWNYERNGDLKPEDIMPGDKRRVWWRCKKGHEWQAQTGSRTMTNTGCPICTNHRLLPGFNDLATTHPELVKEWNWEKNGSLTPSDVFAGSRQKVWWKCEHGHEWEGRIDQRIDPKHRCGCPGCWGSPSYRSKYEAMGMKPAFPYRKLPKDHPYYLIGQRIWRETQRKRELETAKAQQETEK